MKQKTLIVDWNDIRSIEFAEKQKTTLENKGYIFKRTIHIGNDIDKLIYEKPN